MVAGRGSAAEGDLKQFLKPGKNPLCLAAYLGKKELAEGQLSKGLGEHGITILSPKGKRSPRQIWVKYCNLMLLLYF